MAIFFVFKLIVSGHRGGFYAASSARSKGCAVIYFRYSAAAVPVEAPVLMTFVVAWMRWGLSLTHVSFVMQLGAGYSPFWSGGSKTYFLYFFGGKETASPPEQRYRPRSVRAGIPGLLDLAGSHRPASKRYKQLAAVVLLGSN